MEEIINKLKEFKNWMYDCLDNGDNPTIGDVINKFNSLNLNNIE